MKKLVARAYLSVVGTTARLPCAITSSATLSFSENARRLPFIDDSRERANSSFVLDLSDIDERAAIQSTQAIICAMQLAAGCAPAISGFWSVFVGQIPFQNPPQQYWGGGCDDISEHAVEFAGSHAKEITSLEESGEYSRVANALRLYRESLTTRNPDLALLGFVGSMESLFTSGFRREKKKNFCVFISGLLGDSREQQKTLYDRASRLYWARSNIAHGDRLSEDEENAAIQLVDNWTPDAEELARLSLKCVLQQNLIAVFNEKERRNDLREKFLSLLDT